MKILLIALLPLMACQNPQDQTSGNGVIKLIDGPQLIALLKADSIQLVDIRTDGEVANGIISGAQQIDFSSPNFMKEFEKLNKEQPVVVYCAVGGRSARAASSLQKAGFKEIYDLRGGIQDWQARGLPLSKD